MKNGPYELIVPPKAYPGKRYRGRYAYEHRVVWWETTGKNPDDFPEQLIHHQDEHKRNNDPTNLELKKRDVHTTDHKKTGRTMHELICKNCNQEFTTIKYNQQFCSRTCIGLYNYPGV